MRLVQMWLLVVLINVTAEVMGDPKGSWDTISIFNQAPLEIKLGASHDGPDPDLVALVLWNDSVNNRLDAVHIPPPYDGTGITTTALENTAILFNLGSLCTDGTNLIAPYIKDFNLEVARFNGSNWSTMTVPGTTTNNFDNANCGANQDGIFLGAHDLTDGETEYFRSTNGGSNYTFYGRYTSAGPFDGAIREPLVTTDFTRYLYGLNQQSNGQVRVSRTSTAGASASFSHFPIENLPAPAGFTFVKEGVGVANGPGVAFTYNSEGTARLVEVPNNNPGNTTERNLGMINNNGSQFTFQGGAITTFKNLNGVPASNKILWGDYWYVSPYNNSAQVLSDVSFPLTGVGGPVATCQVSEQGAYTHDTQLVVGGPRVGSTGTDLQIRDVNVDSLFTDGFESGDTTAWFATCP
ncbi:hypothetical protein [Marinicella meishanensis]|uniref:hypothetical protein n=1 Tax=Marinicella meishanensis TaxID=2873263 RepID=UPI001CBC7FC5|nr:hypothetical protein [Marinicella sp. NBU2979]